MDCLFYKALLSAAGLSIRSNLGFSVLYKDTTTCGHVELEIKQPSFYVKSYKSAGLCLGLIQTSITLNLKFHSSLRRILRISYCKICTSLFVPGCQYP